MRFSSLTIAFVPALLAAAPLVDCPDCGGRVSSRAVMCPHCGAPAEAIAEAVAALEAEKEVPKKTPDNVLVAKVNGCECYALPVAMKDGAFAVLPASALDGLETLELFFASTNAPVAYGTPSVAQGAPLVRLPITETNLTFHAIATKADEGFAFDSASLPPEGAEPVASVRVAPSGGAGGSPAEIQRQCTIADGPSAPPDVIPLSEKLLWRDVPPRELKALFNQPKEKP